MAPEQQQNQHREKQRGRSQGRQQKKQQAKRQEQAKQQEQRAEIAQLEDGNIYFFYRPRVEQEEPEGKRDVQNFYMVLSPRGKRTYRLLIVGREQMPSPGASGKQRYWGFVDRVSSNAKDIVDELGEKTYGTKTRGTRHQPAARPAGEGIYQIVGHEGHTHLVYALELPRDAGDVQEALNIEDEASYILSIKNPEQPSPPRGGLKTDKRAEFPQELQERFRGRRFSEADPPDFLGHEGAEFLLIPASADVKAELGIELRPEDEDASSAEIFKDLRLRKSQQPLEPLFEGVWQ